MTTNRRYKCIAFDAVGNGHRASAAGGGGLFFRWARPVRLAVGAGRDRPALPAGVFAKTEQGDPSGLRARPIENKRKTAEKERWRRIVATVIDDISRQWRLFCRAVRTFLPVPKPGSVSMKFPSVSGRAERSRLSPGDRFEFRRPAACRVRCVLRTAGNRHANHFVPDRPAEKPGRGFFEALVARAGLPCRRSADGRRRRLKTTSSARARCRPGSRAAQIAGESRDRETLEASRNCHPCSRRCLVRICPDEYDRPPGTEKLTTAI